MFKFRNRSGMALTGLTQTSEGQKSFVSRRSVLLCSESVPTLSSLLMNVSALYNSTFRFTEDP